MGNTDGNEKLFPPFQVRGNGMVMEQLIPPNSGAWTAPLKS